MILAAPVDAASPPRFRDALPQETGVAIIGGGIAGVMTALYLRRDGVRVALFEKGLVAAEQSSRNWGWVRAQGRDAAEIPVMLTARRLWRALAQDLGDVLGLATCGVSYLARDQAALDRYEAWLDVARAHGLDSRLVGRAELARILPNGAGWVGALTTPSDMRAEPGAAVPAIAALAHAEGVLIREHCAVRGLDIRAGRVAGVMTEDGPVRAERVLLAGGAWSGLFAANAGLSLPQLSVRATVAATRPMAEFWSGAAADPGFAFRRRADGGYTLAPGTGHDFWIGPAALRHLRAWLPQIRRDLRQTRLQPAAPRGFPDAWTTPRRWPNDRPSPFEAMRVLNPAPDPARLERLRRDFAAAFPQAGPPVLRAAWAGMIDATPDQVPVLDRAPLPGLFIATGLSGHGFGIGPGVGRVMADLIQGRAPEHDLTRFRFSRFSDGSPMILGPDL
ncbi:NAD(P)/FAD-dependent oxidoreductase [Paracoccus siganidrum]|uniref:FAD-binding oxidoreductase n=1 Tax=Paracoccus siganidrum TaxID=1276757 RepID=A0A419ABG5_9RHOB|nr:FAD-binding oxidoreductase [Paracoccus siganidrum]RJL20878.1 FAD-binding oxidoreductase [Paracoccus siganidrum]RMC34054.1 FAD-dependent oxidoreductase [Paracoccus siganidrum]